MHIHRHQIVSMIDHDIISHTGGIACCHYLTVVSRQDRRTARSRQIHTVVKFLHMQCRVHTPAKRIRYSGILGRRPGKLAAIVMQTLCLCQCRFVRCDRRLHVFDQLVLCCDLLIIFPDRLFLIRDIRFVCFDLRLLLRDQRFQIILLLLRCRLGCIQHLFFFLKHLLGQIYLLNNQTVFIQFLTVIIRKHLDIIRFVQHIRKGVRRQKQFQIQRFPIFVHKADALFHRFILFGRGLLRSQQFCPGYFDLRFFRGDLHIQSFDVLLDRFDFLIKRHHIRTHLALLGFQTVNGLLHALFSALQRFLFILQIPQLILLFADALFQGIDIVIRIRHKTGTRQYQSCKPDSHYG